MGGIWFQEKIMKNYNLHLVTLQVNWDILFRSRTPGLFKEVYLPFKQMEVLQGTQMEGRLRIKEINT